MAQIIKHRRGSLESLASITASLQKGEIVIASGSSNLTVSNGTSLVFAAAENGVLQPINRFLVGTSAPNTFANSTYNGLLNGVPYYDSTSGSLYILGSDTNTKLDLLGNINGFSQSVDSRLDTIEASLGGGGSVGARVAALEIFSASEESKNVTIGIFTSSVNTFTASEEAKNITIGTFTSSINQFTASEEAKNVTLGTFTASINQFTASEEAKNVTLGTFTASINEFTASEESKNQTLATLTGSIANEQTAQNNRLSTIESFTGSYATTGSNVFFGNQVITGSVYIAYDLVVQGSSSLQDITASAVDIGTNKIRLNTNSPAVRFAGLEVYDSGSQQTTGSLFWDSLRDHWVSVRPSSSTEVANSAVLIYGPINTGSLGDESLLTAGKILVAQGEDHIADSIMTQTTGKITVAGNLDVTGEVSSSTIAGLGNASTFSQSVDNRLDTIEASIGGGGALASRVSSLEIFSASEEAKNITIGTFTSSINEFTASEEAKNVTLGTFTASVNTFTASVNTFTASEEAKNVTLGIFTSSVNTFTASEEAKNITLGIFTASVNTFTASEEAKNITLGVFTSSINQFTASEEAKNITLGTFTSSINAFTASEEAKNITLGTYTASVNAQLASLQGITGSYATTGSNTFVGNQTISASLNVSGSTNFNGAVAVNDSNMNLTNSSSLNLTSGSSIYVAATGVISGSIVGIGNVEAFSQSVDSRIQTLSSSVDSRLDTLEGTFSTSVDQRLDSVEAYTASLKTAIGLNGTNVTINGDLTVAGTTTTISSTTVQIGDNIIELNGTGVANGGLLVKDPTSPTTGTGSFVWDSNNDYWKAGFFGAESKVLLADGDSVVSGSSQITISSTTGFTSFSSSIATDFTNTNLSSSTAVTNLSSSVSASQYVQDLRLGVLEGTGTIQGVGTNNTVSFTAVSASLNVPTVASGNASSKRVAFRNAIGTIDFAPSASVAGDLLQWDGTDFVMSNVIDGGSF